MKPIIEIIQKDLKMQVEGAVIKAVQECGVNVDKERLEKALYDARSFYREGYCDGYEAGCQDGAAKNPPPLHGKWLNRMNGNATCSVCGLRSKAVYDLDNEQHYCGHCGAKMDGGNANDKT